jgi:hypothetical protein
MRIKNDYYPTPAWMTQCLIKYADIQGSIFEPAAGETLAIAKCFASHKVTTNDLYSNTANWHLDASTDQLWSNLSKYTLSCVADWVITNPPFNCQQKIIERSYKYARVGVAMLLRVTADEMVVSEKEHDRAQWWADHPEQLQIKMPRFSFAKSSKTGKSQTDSAYCQWVVWRKDAYRYDQPIIRIPHWEIDGFTRKPVETIA